MTWLQMFMAYYVGYQLISFLRYCYLAKTNKEKGHKPKPSLSTAEWEKRQAEKSSKAKKTTQPKKNQPKKKGKTTKGK